MVEYWVSEGVRWAFQLLIVGFVTRTWLKWKKAAGDPNRKDLSAFLGFLATNLSASLSFFGFLYSYFVDIGFYNPVEMFCIKLGMLSSLCGIVGGAFGKGLLRRPSIVLSIFMGLLWFGAAMAQ